MQLTRTIIKWYNSSFSVDLNDTHKLLILESNGSRRNENWTDWAVYEIWPLCSCSWEKSLTSDGGLQKHACVWNGSQRISSVDGLVLTVLNQTSSCETDGLVTTACSKIMKKGLCDFPFFTVTWMECWPAQCFVTLVTHFLLSITKLTGI